MGSQQRALGAKHHSFCKLKKEPPRNDFDWPATATTRCSFATNCFGRYFQRPVARDWTARRVRPTRTSCTARRATARRLDPKGTGSREEQPGSPPTCRQVCSVQMIWYITASLSVSVDAWEWVWNPFSSVTLSEFCLIVCRHHHSIPSILCGGITF